MLSEDKHLFLFILSRHWLICAKNDKLMNWAEMNILPINFRSNFGWKRRLLLRSSKNAFIVQSKSTFLEFLRSIHHYKFGLPKKFFRGEIIQGEWHNFHQARALFLTEVLTCILVFFLVEFDLLVAFSVLSCRILDCASLFIYVHEYDRRCFPILTKETAVFDQLHLLTYRNFRPITRAAHYPHRSIFAIKRKNCQQITRTGR